MPPNTRDQEVILMYLLHMAEKLGYRLRRHTMEAMHFFVGLRYDGGWLADRFKTSVPVSDSRLIHKICHYFLTNYWHGEGVHGVQVTALDPRTGRFTDGVIFPVEYAENRCQRHR